MLINDYGTAFDSLPEPTKVGIKTQLLISILNEEVAIMRRKIADVAAEIVHEDFGKLLVN